MHDPYPQSAGIFHASPLIESLKPASNSMVLLRSIKRRVPFVVSEGVASGQDGRRQVAVRNGKARRGDSGKESKRGK